MKFNKDQDYWASVYCTKEFLLIETQSGFGRTSSDPLFPPHLLQLDANDQCLVKPSYKHYQIAEHWLI